MSTGNVDHECANDHEHYYLYCGFCVLLGALWAFRGYRCSCEFLCMGLGVAWRGFWWVRY